MNTEIKAAYISLTKTGHSSMNKMFPNINNFRNFNKEWLKIGKQQYLKQNSELDKYNYLFSVVRNPEDRFISSFKECKKRYGYKSDIDQFILDFKEGKLNPLQLWHTDFQSKHIISEELNLIIKLEDLKFGIEQLCADLSIPVPKIIFSNKNTEKIRISDSQKKEIKNIFKKDYEIFGY